jgi:hypothetical protein
MQPPRAVTGLGCLVALCSVVSASPTPVPNVPHQVAESQPMVTPFRVQYVPTRTLQARGNILSQIEGGVNSVLSKLGSAIPSYVASGASDAQCLVWSIAKNQRHSQFLPRFPNGRQCPVLPGHQQRSACRVAHQCFKPPSLWQLDKPGMECQVPWECMYKVARG